MGWIEDLNKNVNQRLEDFWGQATRPVNYATPSKEKRLAVKNPSSGSTMSRPNRSWSENIAGTGGRTPVTQRTADKATATSGRSFPKQTDPNGSNLGKIKRSVVPDEVTSSAQVEKSALEKFQDYLATIDPGDYDYKKAVTDAFAKAYANIDNAAKTARDNKASSASAIAGLAQGGANIVKGEAKDYQRITDNTANTNNTIYKGAVSGLQEDRSKELADRAMFLERLGIKEAGLGTAGSTQTNAINEALGAQTRNADRINAYGQADQALNTSRAQSILNEGTTRQAGLESQLQKILGSLEDKRADYSMQEAQALSQAEQAAYQNQLAKFQAGLGAYQQQIDNDFKSRDQQMQEAEFMAKYGQGGEGGQGQVLSPTGSQAADAYVTSQGADAGRYRSFMTDFRTQLANDPQVRMNQASPDYIRSKILQAADAQGLDLNLVSVMFELETKAPVKYMDQ